MVREHKTVRRIKPVKNTKHNKSAKSKRLEEVGLKQKNLRRKKGNNKIKQ